MTVVLIHTIVKMFHRKNTIKPTRHSDNMYKVFTNTEGKLKGRKLEQALQDNANREIEKQKARKMYEITWLDYFSTKEGQNDELFRLYKMAWKKLLTYYSKSDIKTFIDPPLRAKLNKTSHK